MQMPDAFAPEKGFKKETPGVSSGCGGDLFGSQGHNGILAGGYA